MKKILLATSLLICLQSFSQTDKYTLLKPDLVFDGENMQTGWIVLVKNQRIEAAGPMNFKLPAGTEVIELKGMTLLPGLIEGHSHIFLHPYNETLWDDQVLKESRAERTARAVNHAKATLLAGFTTIRDLGTEGAFYDDAGLKRSIEKKIIPGPRMIVATRAIVAKGAYAPKTADPDLHLPQGAAEVSSPDEMEFQVRDQISKGADLIKVYADFGYGPNKETTPTLTVEEMARAVQVANASGRQVVAHAQSIQGMLNAIRAGVSTIEHGDHATLEVYQLMKEKNIALCPTLAALEAYQEYFSGYKKGVDPETNALLERKKTFQLALSTGVKICMGGDVGVFSHGDNAREMEMMAAYGMKAIDVLRAATSVNADVFGYGDRIGRIKKGLLADLIAVENDPSIEIKNIRKVQLVIKNGERFK